MWSRIKWFSPFSSVWFPFCLNSHVVQAFFYTLFSWFSELSYWSLCYLRITGNFPFPYSAQTILVIEISMYSCLWAHLMAVSHFCCGLVNSLSPWIWVFFCQTFKLSHSLARGHVSTVNSLLCYSSHHYKNQWPFYLFF